MPGVSEAPAAPLGSSTASVGAPLASLTGAVQAFQPDLFTGRATMAVPLEAAPGRQGMQPHLTLAYNSGGPNGWVGVGWSLDVGSIERSTRHGVPAYNGTDEFVLTLNGSQSDMILAGDGTYRTEDEGAFLKFEYNGTRWVVWSTEGTRMEFGTSAASRHTAGGGTFKWFLDRVEDLNGNTLTVTYAADSNGTRYPQQVRYTGHTPTGDPGAHTVDFVLENRPDVFSSYRCGSRMQMDKRLASVEMRASGQLVRRYVLGYTLSARTGRSLLTSVTQVGSDGTSSLPATTFTYEAGTPTYEGCTSQGQATQQIWNIRTASGDRFGDNGPALYPSGYWSNGMSIAWGATHMLATGADNGVTWQTQSDGNLIVSGGQDTAFHAWTYVKVGGPQSMGIHTGGSGDPQPSFFVNGAYVAHSSITSLPLQAGWNLIEITGYNQNSGYAFNLQENVVSQVDAMNAVVLLNPQYAGDFNGDGRTDLASFGVSTGTWKVSTANSCNAVPEMVWRTGFGESGDVMLIGDQNGDGKADLFRFRTADGLWSICRSNGTAFETGSASPIAFGAGQTPLLGEFNGDGWLDLATFYQGQWTVALGMVGTYNFETQSVWRSGFGTNGTPLTGDFNGDGLTDIGYKSGGAVFVAFSTGSGFDVQPTAWIAGLSSSQEVNTADFNGDGLSDLCYYDNASGDVRMARCTGFSFVSVESLDTNFTLQGVDTVFQVGDFTGDAMADPAVFHTLTGAVQMAHSEGIPPDLLNGVANGLGGAVALEYTASTSLNNTGADSQPDLPMSVPVVIRSTSHDGMGHAYVTEYSYSGGYFDPVEKEFLGFSTVAVQDAAGMITETQFHQDAPRKGRPHTVTVKDTDDNIYAVTQNVWSYTQNPNGVYFARLDQADAFVYDGDSAFKQTRVRYEYDGYGNVVRVREDGEVGVAGDGRVTVTEFVPNLTAWIVRLPSRTRVLDETETTQLSMRKFYYDGSTNYSSPPTAGRLTKVKDWLRAETNPPGSAQEINTTFWTYDEYGNVASVKDALQRITTTTYDQTLHTYPVSVTNAAGHTQTAVYDARFGVATSATDANNQTTQTVYDVFGRAVKVIGPNDTSALPTLTYEYTLSSTAPSRVAVERRVQSGQAATLRSLQFVDGLGRTIQTRSPAEEAGDQIVSGVVEFNSRGEVAKQYLPYQAAASESYVDERSSNPNLPYVSYTYDAVGRTTLAMNPDSTTTGTTYDDWTVTVTDAVGRQMRQTRDAYGRLVKVEEFNAGQTYTTRYVYDLLGRLTGVTDHAGNQTQIFYDSFGRKIRMIDPDMGEWTYGYDWVGNLVTQTDSRDVVTTMAYDALNRLTNKSYAIPGGSGVAATASVVYTYDDANVAHSKGRLTRVDDGSGYSIFAYDNLGRLITESKTVSGQTYSISRTYDLLGRLMGVTYPDGDAAAYTYNDQGGLDTMTFTPQGGSPTTLVSGVVYNQHGQPTAMTYGNGVTTTHVYDALTLRLSSLQTQNASAQALQELSYAYDPVGNITAITDGLTSGNSQTFQYDDLNRLTFAQGAYGAQNYAYDALGNMISKEGHTYTYGAPGGDLPHAVTKVTDPSQDETLLNYDANGNLVSKIADGGESLTLTYDAENRLVQAVRETAQTTGLSVEVTLQPGWNFFSVPVTQANLGIGAVLSGIAGQYSQVSRYNPATQEFEHSVGNAAYDEFSSFELGRGYQVYVTAGGPVTLTLTGDLPTAGYALAAGTHLVGVQGASPVSVAELLNGLTEGVDYGEVWAYDGAGSTTALSQTDEVAAGTAVYVDMLQAGTLTPCGAPVTTMSMAYDGDGGRVRVTSDGVTTTYLGQVAEVTNGVLTKHLYFGDQRIGSISSGAPTYVHGDHLGSTNIESDTTGAESGEYTYTPYGEFVTEAPTTTGSQHRYTGQRYDSAIGLYYYGSRYYDPGLGRFISPDDFVPSPGQSQSFNRYSYVYNNPINFTDPDGHFAWLAFAIGALIGGVSAGVQSYKATGKIGWGGVALNALLGGISAGALAPSTTAASLKITAFSKTSLALLKSSAALSLGAQVTGAAGWTGASESLGMASRYLGYTFAGLHLAVGVANWIHDPRFRMTRISGDGPLHAAQSGDAVHVNGMLTPESTTAGFSNSAIQEARAAGANVLAYSPTSSPIADLTESFLSKVLFTGSVERQMGSGLSGLTGITLSGFSQGGIIASNVALGLGLGGQRGVIAKLVVRSSQVSQVRVAFSGSVAGGLRSSSGTVTYGAASPFDFSNALGPNLRPEYFLGGLIGLAALPVGIANHKL